MKYMILTYGAQRDYAAMTGAATDGPVWTPDDFAAMGAFMESFSKELEASRGAGGAPGGGRSRPPVRGGPRGVRAGPRASFAGGGVFWVFFPRGGGPRGELVEPGGPAGRLQ